MIKKELQSFFTAVMFFTRIPTPKWIDHSSEALQNCSKYFSLVGIIVGGFGALIYFGVLNIFSVNIALIISMISTIWITGAFHEDGLADVCDGFGGGYTKEKILAIMKDSQLGSYGSVGLICILGLKFVSLIEIPTQFILTIIAGHSISRTIAVFILYFFPYARTEGISKAKPIANNFKLSSLIVNCCIGIIPMFFYDNYWMFLAIIPPFICMLLLGRFFKKWIGGQTGDCAGATQQITEVVFYLSLLVLWRFI